MAASSGSRPAAAGRPAPRWQQALQRAWWSTGATWPTRVLAPLAACYGLLARWRAAAYRRGWLQAQDVGVPVVVVGNLIVGGAGKTPTVIALVQALQAAGWTPGVISRGHGSAVREARAVMASSTAAAVGDEPLLIARRTGAPVWVGHERVAVALGLRAANPAVNVIVADDGLQHLALRRDAQLIVFDGRGIGNGRLLPAGPLREPMGPRVPARSVVLYNADAPSTPWPGACAPRALGALLPLRAWWCGDLQARLPLDDLLGRRLIAAAGIGAPQRFFDMLEAAGLRFERLPLVDHAPLQPRPWPPGDAWVVVTEKDAVKLPPDAPDAGRIVVATLDFGLPAETLAPLLAWLQQAAAASRER